MKRLDLDRLAVVLFVGSMLAVLYYSWAGSGIPILARALLAAAVMAALSIVVARERPRKSVPQASGSVVLTHGLMLLAVACWLLGAF